MAQPRTLQRLSARKVATLTTPGRYSDGGGLYLTIGKTGRKCWVFMYMRQRKAHECGLGSFPTISLAAAREKALRCRLLLTEGLDPIEHRKSVAVRQAGVKTFGDCVAAFLKSKRPAWRSQKHAVQYERTLAVHCASLMSLPVAAIDTTSITKILEPLWLSRSVTGGRLLYRIAAILDYAKAHNWREGPNPAQWRGHLEFILPRHNHSRKHLAALPYQSLPAFIRELNRQKSVQVAALTFIILTATRSAETLGAVWDEFHLGQKLWTIPAARMKAYREHRVPLSDQCLALLRQAAEWRTGDLIFPGRSGKRPLSSWTLLKLLPPGCTTHGTARSSFRDFCAEQTEYARDVCEQALAHAIGSEVERAYYRSDLLDRRRALMQAWSDYSTRELREIV